MFFYSSHSHFSYLLFIYMRERDARWGRLYQVNFFLFTISPKINRCCKLLLRCIHVCPRFCFKVLFLICILLLHLFIVLYLYFHLKTFQIWFVGACCSAGSTMPLDSSSNTSLLSNTTIDTNTNIVINCIFILICVCLRICIYISVLYLQSAGCQSAPKPHNIE